MPKSRDISDYFEVKLTDLKPGETVEFDVHLYFSQNRHIMLWRKAGETITEHFLDKYRSRGIGSLWIHRDDSDAYYNYVNPPAQDPETARMLADAELAAAARIARQARAASLGQANLPRPVSEDGAKILEAMKSDALTPEEKKTTIAEVAQELLKKAATPSSQKFQKLATQQAREVVQDILEGCSAAANMHVSDLIKLANVDPDLEHAVNVSTYAVIFAMAFGRIDNLLLADLALAGLLHDVGLSQVSASVTTLPWKEMSPAETQFYGGHVGATLDLLADLAPDVPERVRAIILQHHEKFDGTGYPRRLQGFGVDDIAQLLAIADILDSMASGRWDGHQRTLKDTFSMLEKLEKARTFPEYFNPEVFAAVVGWIRKAAGESTGANAVSIVKKQSRQLVRKAARL